MRPRSASAVLAFLASVPLLLGAASVEAAGAEPAPVEYVDVEEDHWADAAVAYTAEDRDWLRFGGDRFRPGRRLQRWHLARAAVRAFAPDAVTDPEITFTDLTSGQKWRYSNIATALGWFPRVDAFDAHGSVNKRLLNRVLVRALGLADAARDLARISTEDGYRFETPKGFAYLVMGNELALNPNFGSPNDRRDLYPWEEVNRGMGAIALMQAANAGWRVWSAQQFTGITLPKMRKARRKVVEFAFAYAGYPYVYAGEWHRRSEEGSCCGFQPKGGFDCSGFQWWVTQRAGASGFDNTFVRPYKGWRLGERRASLIAREADKADRLRYRDVRPADLVFFETGFQDGTWRGIDHGGVALGNGWFIHSSGSRAGVTISWMGDGWWRDAFEMGRALIG